MNVKSYFYFNLHKKCWSQMQHGRVVDHMQSAELWDVEFRVRPGGRARVLLEHRKNVHAFAISDRHAAIRMACTDPARWPGEWVEIGYSPYKGPHFVRKDTQAAVTQAARVILTDDRKVFAQLEGSPR